MHIQPTNQTYANQNQTIVSNVAAVPYSMQGTHATPVMQQATSQMNSVNQSNVNLQQNYVNSTIPNQQIRPATIVQQSQPVIVKPMQVTQQPTVVNNPNRNNVISSETGERLFIYLFFSFLFFCFWMFFFYLHWKNRNPNCKLIPPNNK